MKPELLYVDATKGGPLSPQKLADASSLPDMSAHSHIKRIVCISDTHERHHQIDIPAGSVLIHSGDILTINRHFTTSYSELKLDDFAQWFGALLFPEGKVIVAGNHDAALEDLGTERVQSIFHGYDSQITYLEDDSCKVGGLVLWASPLSYGSSENKAFQSSPDERLAKIPTGGAIDILVTHGPLSGSQIDELQPRLHVCGHIHGRYGAKVRGKTLCINASIMDGRYQPTHGAVVVDMTVCETPCLP